MAESGRGGGAEETGGGQPCSPLRTEQLKEGAPGEVPAFILSTGVSNGDCAPTESEELPPSPDRREGKSGIPRRSSIIKNAVVSFKELCGLSPVANFMQCILALSTRLVGPDNTPLVVMNLSDQYPTMELQGMVPEVLRKIVTAYEAIIQSSKVLIESADAIYEKIAMCQKAAMEYHEKLHSIGIKEGLKERKLNKAVENFTWNITLLKGQADLLKYAKIETMENLKQTHYAALSCGLNKPGTGSAEVAKPRRSLEAIPEKGAEETGD